MPLSSALWPGSESPFCALAVAVDLDDGGIDHGVFHVRLVGARFKNPSKNIGFHPVAVSLEDRVPFAEMRRQITPGTAGARDPENRLKKKPVVAAAAAGIRRLPQTMRLHLRPLGVCQYVSIHPKLESQTSLGWNPEPQQALVLQKSVSSWLSVSDLEQHGHARRDLDVRDFGGIMAAQRDEQGPYRIAVGTYEHRFPLSKTGGDLCLVVAAGTRNHVLQALASRRGDVVAAPPDVHLLRPELLRRFRFVQARKLAVIALSQIVMAGDVPAAIPPKMFVTSTFGQGNFGGFDRPAQGGGKRPVKTHAGQRPSSLACFLSAQIGQADIDEACEAVFRVPFALTVAQ